MMDFNYSKVDIDAMVVDLDIDDSNKEQLRKTLRKFEHRLFGGGLGQLKNCKPAHIKLKLGVIPYKGCYYNLHRAYEDVAMKEIQRMVDIGVLKELPWHNGSPWATPSFSVPEKTRDIQIVTDFRELNKWVEVDPFPLPRINETLHRNLRSSSLIPLDEESQKLCATILPWRGR